MIFTLGAPLVTLGTNYSLVRYVSVFEARGELQKFFRRVLLWVLCMAILLTAALFLLSPNLLDALCWVRAKFQASTSSMNSIFDWSITRLASIFSGCWTIWPSWRSTLA